MNKKFENNTYCNSPPEIKSLTQERLKQVELQKLNEKNWIKKECISNISWFKRENLANEMWHEVKPWDNLWRIILENTNISLNSDEINQVQIHPWDKVQFWHNIVYISHNWKISWKISLENKDIKKEIKVIVQNVLNTENKPQDNILNNKPKTHTKTQNNIEKSSWKVSYQDFLKLDLQDRVKLVSNKTDNWYIKLNFPNNDILNNIKITDIIPDKYKNVEIINTKHNKFWNYYNIYEIQNWLLKSALIWDWYKDLNKLENWLLIRPVDLNNNYSKKLIFKEKWNSTEEQIAAQNEKIIRSLIWDYIKEVTKHLKKWSALNEKFIYAIIAQESKFNPNAKSSMNALWLWQVNSITTAWVIEKNTDLKSNVNNLKDNAPDYLFTIWPENIPNWDNINISYTKNWDPRVKWLKEQSFDVMTNLKLTINHLIALDDKFDEIKNIDYKRAVIAAAYNWWETKIWKIINNNNPQNVNWLLKLVNNEQTKDYVNKTKKYYNMQNT